MGLSRVISTLVGVISSYNCSYLTYNPNYYVPWSFKYSGPEDARASRSSL